MQTLHSNIECSIEKIICQFQFFFHSFFGKKILCFSKPIILASKFFLKKPFCLSDFKRWLVFSKEKPK